MACAIGAASSASLGGNGMFRPHLLGGLILAQSFEGGLANHAGTGPAGELDLGDQNRLHPGPVGLLAWSVLAGKRTLVGRVGLELFEQVFGVARIEAGADLPDMDEMVAAINAGDQRAQVGSLPLQPPITTSWPARHLDLTQVSVRPDDRAHSAAWR